MPHPARQPGPVDEDDRRRVGRADRGVGRRHAGKPSAFPARADRHRHDPDRIGRRRTTAGSYASADGVPARHRSTRPPRRFGDRPALSLRRDDGASESWSFRELDRRSRAVAWRLRALGLGPGDRMLTWSPSTPALPAVYFGAMRAGVVIVPLDLRMSPDAIERIAEKAEADAARDRHRPRRPGPARGAASSTSRPRPSRTCAAEPDADWPADWAEQVASLAATRRRPTCSRSSSRSGTTGHARRA